MRALLGYLLSGCSIGLLYAASGCGGASSTDASGIDASSADATAGSGGGGGSGCGPCPGVACLDGIRLFIAPDVDAGASVIASISVTAPGLTFDCTANGSPCQWSCDSGGPIPDGDYAVQVSAPGYQLATIDFHAVSATNCGCCGCCPYGEYKSLTLEPNGSSIAGCCANLQNDPVNCGACGHSCLPGSACRAGKCAPSVQGCLKESDGYATCGGYCQSMGGTCAAACGPNNNAAVLKWTNGATCSGSYQTGACSDALQSPATYACCCGDP